MSVTFDRESHTYYTAGGARVERSCSALAHQWFEAFDPDSVIATYYSRWKAKGQYNSHIEAARRKKHPLIEWVIYC